MTPTCGKHDPRLLRERGPGLSESPSKLLIDDIRAQIAKGQLIVIVGSGVSVGATQGARTSSWTGLLHAGVTRAEAVDQGKLPPGWAGRMREQIDSGRLAALLAAAEGVTQALGGRSGGEYGRWLRESVGALPVSDRSVLEALAALRVPLATTNYDGLLEEVTGLRPVTWRDGARVQRVLRGDEPGILHLHGHWDEPESVVLGVCSYESVLGDAPAQALQHAMASLRSLLFVGFGAGLQDPNFEALRAWLAATFPGTEYRHFRLCRDSEFDEVGGVHQPEERIMAVRYGTEHSELAPFLAILAPTRSIGVTAQASHPPLSPQIAMGLAPAPVCVGRDAELAALVVAMLAEPPLPLPVLGGPGIGKSTLCLAVLHAAAVVQRFGAARWLVRCDGATGPGEIVSAISAELGITDIGSLEFSLLRRLLEQLTATPGVLVLDNFETPWSAEPLAVERLLGKLAAVPGLVLVAAIRGTARPGGVQWRHAAPLAPLKLEDARTVFLGIAGEQFADDGDLDALLEAVDRVPLAVTLLAHNAQGESSLAGLARRWEQERITLLERAGGRHRELSMAVSVELSVRNPIMTDDGLRLLSLLGVLPEGINASALTQLLPKVGDRAAGLLRQLGLAYDDELGRLRCLAPIREHAHAEYVPTDTDRTAAAAYYCALAAQGNRIGAPGGAEAASRIVAEYGNIAVSLRSAAGLKLSGPFVDGTVGFLRLLRFTGSPDQHSFSLNIDAVPDLSSGQRARVLHEQAQLALQRVEYGSARELIEQALPLYQQAGDPLGAVNCIFRLGHLALDRGEHDTARVLLERALPIYREVGEILGEANCISSLGKIALDRSEYDSARGLLKQALPIYRQVGDVLGEANCLSYLGKIALDRSEHDSVRELLEQAQLLYRQIGALGGEANCFFLLGMLALQRSEHDSARRLLEQALPMYRQVGDVLGETNCVSGLGKVALELGELALRRLEHDVARASFEQALQMYQQVGYGRGAATCLFSLGQLARDRSEHDNAREHFEQARAMYRQAGEVLGEADCLFGLGKVALDRREYDSARGLWEQALSMYRRVGGVLGEANCIRNLGQIALLEGEHDIARGLFEQALPMFRRVGDVRGEANCIRNLGELARGRREPDGARGLFEQALISVPTSRGRARRGQQHLWTRAAGTGPVGARQRP